MLFLLFFLIKKCFEILELPTYCFFFFFLFLSSISTADCCGFYGDTEQCEKPEPGEGEQGEVFYSGAVTKGNKGVLQ